MNTNEPIIDTLISDTDCAAIVPAKAESSRLPYKNFREVGGYPLFLQAVQYAYNEGVRPIVSTDSPDIIRICQERGIDYIREVVDASTLTNCVVGVLGAYPTLKYVALLQPTSPFRVPGMLRKMFMATIQHKKCHITTSMEKQLGVWGNKTRVIEHNRKQNLGPDKFFYAFDGNIITTTRELIVKHNSIWTDDIVPVVNVPVCSIDVDTAQDFHMVKLVASDTHYRLFVPSYVASVKKICICSNKHDLKRDYSKFVDSCDVVARVNKMENVNTGLAGTRTDVAFVRTITLYHEASYDEKHIDLLREIPLVYSMPSSNDERLMYFQNYGALTVPGLYELEPFSMLTCGIVELLVTFPNAHVYVLGDTKTAVRMIRETSSDDDVTTHLADAGKITFILEEELPDTCQGQFSLPIEVKIEDNMRGTEHSELKEQIDSVLKKTDLNVAAAIAMRKDNEKKIYEAEILKANKKSSEKDNLKLRLLREAPKEGALKFMEHYVWKDYVYVYDFYVVRKTSKEVGQYKILNDVNGEVYMVDWFNGTRDYFRHTTPESNLSGKLSILADYDPLDTAKKD